MSLGRRIKTTAGAVLLASVLALGCDDQGSGSQTETSCTDGIDNDGDNLVDCDDPDCALSCGRCGDGVVNETAGEQCDGQASGGGTCQSLGFHGGTLSCRADCRYDVSGCTGFCGDGVKNGDEECDGLDQGGLFCVDLGGTSGRLGCDATCRQTFDRCTGMEGQPPSPWAVVSTGETTALKTVWGRGPDDIFAAGTGGAILHYNGVAWVPMVTSTSDDLWSLFGSPTGEVYALGHKTLLRLSGSQWIPEPAPPAGVFLRDLWVRGPGDVYVTGGTMEEPVEPGPGVVLHFDGSTWQEIPGLPDGGGPGYLFSIWGVGPSDLYVLGFPGLLHYDGSTWQTVCTDMTIVLGGDMFGTTVGDQYLGDYYFDGTSCAPMELGSFMLSSMSGTSSSNIYSGTVSAFGTILRFDGAGWSPMLTDREEMYHGFWAGPDDTVVAVGDNGTVLMLESELPGPDGGQCDRPVDIYCQSSLNGSTAGQPGGAVTYRLHNPVDGSLTARLTPRGGDLDLGVLGADQAGGCDPDGASLGASRNPGTAVEEVTLSSITQGEVIYFVVDEATESPLAFTIEVECRKE